MMFENYKAQHPEIDCVDCPRVVEETDECGEEHILCRGLPYHDPVEGIIFPMKEARPIKMKKDKQWECDPNLPVEKWMMDSEIQLLEAIAKKHAKENK